MNTKLFIISTILFTTNIINSSENGGSSGVYENGGYGNHGGTCRTHQFPKLESDNSTEISISTDENNK